jgi:hypothetical protein
MMILQIIDFVDSDGQMLLRIALLKLTAPAVIVRIALRASHVTVVCPIRHAI